MVKITRNAELQAKLGATEDVVEVCDPNGRTLGYDVPLVETGHSVGLDACPYSEQELNQMRGETGGRTLDDIWKRLGQS